MTAPASAAPVQRNEKTMPNTVSKNCAERPATAEGEQQEIAGDDRRQDQRQVDETVEQRLAREAPSGPAA